ncbi:MAG: OmpA-OmpF porin, family [Acidobacteriota bacterium]|jgi:outer membrane protein OmpA-like peptidoglycan-associated protein|nr:OmpA-OmpF porin, family [Acidobacteriota bacterium]
MEFKNMSADRSRRTGKLFLAFAFVLTSAAPGFAQSAPDSRVNQSPAQIKPPSSAVQGANVRNVSDGQKMKVEGVVTRRDADTFTVRDMNGVDTVVRLTDTTSVKTKGGFLRSGTNYGTTSILRGLNVEVEGRGDSSGQLVAKSVRFNNSDLRVARSIESRVDPVESRVGNAETKIEQVEQNSQRLSGQIDELAAVSNAARGGAKAAQQSADAAIAGVNATNERISSLDDYVPQETMAINFKVNSALLSKDAKAQLDEIATKALNAKGYVIEVSGFADSTGSVEKNRVLSTRRADAVVRYLAENHRIPLRRIVTPFGYGESQSIADNRTRQGRAENRRVEVKILVSRGLLQSAPNMAVPTEGSSNPE